MVQRAIEPYSWVFVTAQTDVALVTVSATERALVSYAKATCSNSNTGDVSVRIGFATATLPAVVNDSLTPSQGVFLDHGGVAPGGGELTEMDFLGGLGQDIRMSCSAATGGSLRIVLTYRILTEQDTI